jgi:hypothetical protein
MRVGLVSVMALSITASAVAFAQEAPTGSRLGSRFAGSIKYSEEDADSAATKMAACLVNKREPAARAYIEAYSADESDKLRNELFRDVSCLSFINIGGSAMSDTIQVTFPRDVLRGKMAEALLKGKSSAVAALPALPLAKDYSRPWFAATGRNPVIDEMGACVVDTNPKGAAAVLATDAYSKEEAAAFGAVMPNLGTCLRAGAKLQANRQALRAALADALYQRLTRPSLAAQIVAANAAARQGRTQYRKFAECVVGKYSRDAQTYVVEDLSEQETTRLRNKMLDDQCWRASTGLQPPIATTGLKLQGMLAEVMLAAESARGPLPDIKNIPPLNHEPVNEEERRKADPETLKFMEAMYYLFKAGECVVRADVNGADRLLRTGLASSEESEAVAALRPAFEGCPKWDSSFSPSIDELRATIAANYYRLGHPRKSATALSGGAK